MYLHSHLPIIMAISHSSHQNTQISFHIMSTATKMNCTDLNVMNVCWVNALIQQQNVSWLSCCWGQENYYQYEILLHMSIQTFFSLITFFILRTREWFTQPSLVLLYLTCAYSLSSESCSTLAEHFNVSVIPWKSPKRFCSY